MSLFSLGKKRSEFGKLVDRYLGYGGQERLREVTGASRETISKACSDSTFKPSKSISVSLLRGFKDLTGVTIKEWPM